MQEISRNVLINFRDLSFFYAKKGIKWIYIRTHKCNHMYGISFENVYEDA